MEGRYVLFGEFCGFDDYECCESLIPWYVQKRASHMSFANSALQITFHTMPVCFLLSTRLPTATVEAQKFST